MRNNIAVGNREAGIALEDHGRRGLLRGVVVAHNTVVGPRSSTSRRWPPADDFFGAPRAMPPTVGRVARAAGPVVIGPRS